MGNIFEEVMAEGEAKGEAKGEVKGRVQSIRDLVARGLLSVNAARGEIERLIAEGIIPEAQGREAIARLG